MALDVANGFILNLLISVKGSRPLLTIIGAHFLLALGSCSIRGAHALAGRAQVPLSLAGILRMVTSL